jgi:hypothetical protein
MGEERSFGGRRQFWRAGLLYNSLALTINPWRVDIRTRPVFS